MSDEKNIRDIIRDDLLELKKKHANPRRTEISGEEIGSIDMEDLITEENMVVSISHKGYIKRTPASVYRAQRRGGKGLTGAKTDEEDPIAHLFVASTHDYLLFFTNRGKVYWQKVYDLPQLSRESRGRAVVNLLNFAEGRTNRRLPRGARLHRRPFSDDGHAQGAREKDPVGIVQPAIEGRHHRHQAQRRRRTRRRRHYEARR